MLVKSILKYFPCANFSFLFQVILLVMSIKLMDQIRRKQDFMALLESNRYIPGAF